MTPEQFKDWLDEMKAAGLATTKAEAAALLDRTDDTITNFLKRGTDRTTALACTALLHRMRPYGDE